MSTLSALGSAIGSVIESAGMAALPDRRDDPGSVPLLRLVNRMTFGYTREEWALARTLGPRAYIAYHLNYEAINDSEVDSILHGPGYETLWYTPNQLWELYYNRGNPSSVPMIYQLVGATVLRAVRSRRQLFERMVEFWSDHFNIYLFADFCDFLKVHDDTNVSRKHALGKFRGILGASAKSPAMLSYLNNNTNVKQHPNENYARELMELHTLGVDGGYTQRDVMEVAKCFTGWTVFPAGTPTASLSYRFDSSTHDFTAKTLFLGTPQEITIAPGGETQGNKVLDALARHPSTAKFISKKLIKKFWGENPTQEMIDQVAAVFTASDGDIKQVMTAVLWMNLTYWTPRKYKRPFHLMASTMRALDGKLPAWVYAANLVYGCGHYPFLWAAPNGYPDATAYWASLQLPRWNIGASMMDSRYPATFVDARKVMQGAMGTEAVLDRIEDVFLGEAMNRDERSALRGFLGPGGATPPWSKLQDALTLAIAMPSFQWY